MPNRKSSDSKADVFNLPPSGGGFYWLFLSLGVIGLGIWFFCLWCDWQGNGFASLSKLPYSIWFTGFLGLILYCSLKLKGYGKNQIEVSREGITQLEGEKNQVFIKWEEITVIKPNSFMSRITVLDATHGKKIVISYNYENVEDMLTLIFHEYIQKFQLPELPIKYGIPLVPYELIFAAILILVSWGIVWFVVMMHEAHASIGGMHYLFVPLFALVASLFGTRAVVLDKQALRLYGPVHKMIIPWGELRNFSWVMERSQSTSSKSFVVTLETTKGEVCYLQGWAGHQVEIFLSIKKIWNERHGS